MKLSYITEATNKWYGELYNIYGSGKDWSINYGTGDLNRPAMLYIKVPLQFARSWINKIQRKAIVWAKPQATQGEISLDIDNPHEYAEELRKKGYEVYVKPRLHHPGEVHLTIAMPYELEGVDVKNAKVNGVSIYELPVNIEVVKPPLKVFRAGYYKDDVDPYGPLLVALNVRTKQYYQVRDALGLDETEWVPHITLGYILQRDEINQSYIDKFLS